MKIIPIQQRDDSDCGPTCIQMTVNYFKLPYTYDYVAKISKYREKDGLSNEDFIATIRKLNLKVRTHTNTTWATLMRNNTDDNVIIVSWMKFGYIGHFSVVTKVSKNFIEIADPQDGMVIKMEKIIFMRLWMDYDDMWYPSKNTDIQLRWMCVVQKKPEML